MSIVFYQVYIFCCERCSVRCSVTVGEDPVLERIDFMESMFYRMSLFCPKQWLTMCSARPTGGQFANELTTMIFYSECV